MVYKTFLIDQDFQAYSVSDDIFVEGANKEEVIDNIEKALLEAYPNIFFQTIHMLFITTETMEIGRPIQEHPWYAFLSMLNAEEPTFLTSIEEELAYWDTTKYTFSSIRYHESNDLYHPVVRFLETTEDRELRDFHKRLEIEGFIMESDFNSTLDTRYEDYRKPVDRQMDDYLDSLEY